MKETPKGLNIDSLINLKRAYIIFKYYHKKLYKKKDFEAIAKLRQRYYQYQEFIYNKKENYVHYRFFK